jgi:DNA-binding response OmpR family regulator
MHVAKRRLLIVDDEPDITLTLSTILEQNGFEVVSNDELIRRVNEVLSINRSGD